MGGFELDQAMMIVSEHSGDGILSSANQVTIQPSMFGHCEMQADGVER